MRDDAASNPLSFVVAGSLIIGVIGVALFATEEIGGPATISSGEAANRESQAEGLLSLMVDAPPSTARLSLKQAGDPSLNLATFRDLQLTQFTDDTTGLIAYQDAKTGLDVSGMDFHIRSYPTLESARERLGNTRDPHLNVAYIGHVETKFTGGDPVIENVACFTSTFDNDSVRYSITVRNTGTTPTQFYLVLDIDQGPGSDLTVRDQTGLILDGDPATVHMDIPSTAEASCKTVKEVDVTLYGTNKKLATASFSPLDGTGAPADAPGGFLALALRETYYLSEQEVTVEYTAEEGKLLTWKLYHPDETETGLSGSHTATTDGTFTFTAPTVAAGSSVYTLAVTHVEHGATATQQLLVLEGGVVQPFTLDENFDASLQFGEAMGQEAFMVEQLIENFDPSLHSLTGEAEEAADADWPAECPSRPRPDLDPCNVAWSGATGDVYWDEKKILTDSLPLRIDVDNTADCNPVNTLPDQAYPDIIVVGSNVDHNAMTSGGFKLPLRDWVECGGLLIVFGSPDASTQWLQPIFHVGAQTDTGGIAAPDTTHPLLRVPNSLDFGSYDNKDRTWRYTSDAEDYFTNIVNQGDDPITAISDPGDFGRGTVLISNWLPYDLFGDGTGEDEGLYIMDNFLTQAYRDLFLDYGPPIPSNAPVVPAIRQSQIELSPMFGEPNYHPMCKNGDGCHVDMTVLLYVF